MKLNTNPQKGMYDFDPREFKVRKYIFDVWRQVCLSYGYQEYLTPVLESADIYRAKSGEDVGGKELMVFTDKAGRELAMRPEMTPSVTRLVSKNYNNLSKPVRYFSIANFFRNEKPQRGRNREFWQLNYDVFGSSSLNADIEVIEIALQILLKFNPPKNSFKIFVNNRKLLDDVLDYAKIKDKVSVVRLLDKYEKLPKEKFTTLLRESGINNEQVDILLNYVSSTNPDDLVSRLPSLKTSQGFIGILKVLKYFKDLKLLNYIEFNPKVIRGFDYYDGTVFEVFDLNPENTRSMFGGGRYNGLSELFSSTPFDAVGAAPGDETIRIFLKSWGLDKDIIEKDSNIYYIPLLNKDLITQTYKLGSDLRNKGNMVVTGLEEVTLTKALSNANKLDYKYVVIFNTDEANGGYYLCKNMLSGEQKKITLS